MKKGLLGLAFAFVVSANIYGQDIREKRDTVVIESNDKYRVVTNRFSGNWFIGAGAGGQIFFGDHDKQMQTKDRITPAYEFYVGKWFTPGIGFRVAANGLKAKGLTHIWDRSHSTGEVYQDVKNSADLGKLEVQEFKYYNVHGDVLFNLSNMLGGYNPDRFYSISPYLGVGWMSVWEKPKSREVSANIGIYNEFRLSKAFDLTLDLRGSMVNDRFDNEIGERKEEGMFTAALGIAYNLGKRTWDRERTTIITSTYDETELNALRDRINKLANDNEALKKQLAESSSNSITDIKVENKIIVAPILVTFPINKSVVSNEARVNLGYFAKTIKEGKSNVVYNISGYADKGTGSVKTNERLSKERAEAIYNVLVREFGVPANQLSISYHGGVDNMFYDDPRVSRAVIVIGE